MKKEAIQTLRKRHRGARIDVRAQGAAQPPFALRANVQEAKLPASKTAVGGFAAVAPVPMGKQSIKREQNCAMPCISA